MANNRVHMAVGLILFWPTLFFIDGTGPEAQEYGRLKGEYETLEQVSIKKECGYEFKKLTSPEPEKAPEYGQRPF